MIVGTAGHIDHGKTALVEALTGTNSDRLAEERMRGISIDLGFAYLDRPDGSVTGFVDVPGHERFMKNMLAGATGVDFLLLVIAADDGVMPQTREHFAVAQLLGLDHGVIALTKCDLVSPERRADVVAEIRAFLAGSSLAEAPIHEVSAKTGEGIADLLGALDAARAEGLRLENRRNAGGRLRFAIDRSFSLAGAGTIVTGVIWQGALAVGDRLVVSPSGIEARVRSLHVQNRPAQVARAGDRCGINLAGVEASAIGRGDFVIDPVLHAPSERIDAELTVLPDEPRSLRHWSPVRLYHAAGEFPARLALLRDTPLPPGAQDRVQIVLEAPIAATIGDRFVIRDATGSRTMGGGRLIDLRPPRRRRKIERRLAQLDALQIAAPSPSLSAQLGRWPWYVNRDGFARDRALSATEMDDVLAGSAAQQGQADGTTYLYAENIWRQLSASALAEITRFHQQHPQLLGPSASRLVGALEPRLPTAPAFAVLEAMARTKLIAREGGVYRLPDHALGLDRSDMELWQMALPLLGCEARFRPPRTGDIATSLGKRDFDLRRVLKSVARQGKVVEIAPDHFFLDSTLAEIAAVIRDLVAHSPEAQFGVADLRDQLNNGRKVVIQLLEYFDRQGMTIRHDNVRTIDQRRLAALADRVAEPA